MMQALKWQQVHTWRLSQHGLTPRLNRENFVEIVTRTGGIQAQVMSAAELALFTRVEGLSPQDVRSALWQDRSLIKTWAMRGTLHLLSAGELPLYVAARDWHATPAWSNYFAEFGLTTPAQQESFLSAVPHVLEQGPMTRQQLADALAKHIGISKVRDLIIGANWGSPLKPSAYRGDLCFGPSQGQSVTFVNPKTWVGSWQPVETELALKKFVRLYLQAYGPATPEDFARWWGGKITLAKKLFKSMSDELAEVEVEGWQAFALRSTLEPIQRLAVAETIHFLPLFDAYTLGLGRGIEPLLSQTYKNLVFRPQGWISAVVLLNGSIQGVWQHTARRLQTVIKVRLFSAPTAPIRKGIEAEAERLGEFFKNQVSLEYL
ncbi:MAG TPA: winged helix DNA-binding domain-containing protein [Ktedonobacteraceae bacterium]|nr:winged helix DNA-binding domain-containing protein [Ktedonobacteraceae bacterium]